MYFVGKRSVQRSGGSITWSSTDTNQVSFSTSGASLADIQTSLSLNYLGGKDLVFRRLSQSALYTVRALKTAQQPEASGTVEFIEQYSLTELPISFFTESSEPLDLD